MHICVKNCSESLLRHLLSEGHTLSDEIYADAIVYDNTALESFTGITDKNGVFLIDAHGKSDEEIDFCLKNRLYSPIFFE